MQFSIYTQCTCGYIYVPIFTKVFSSCLFLFVSPCLYFMLYTYVDMYACLCLSLMEKILSLQSAAQRRMAAYITDGAWRLSWCRPSFTVTEQDTALQENGKITAAWPDIFKSTIQLKSKIQLRQCLLCCYMLLNQRWKVTDYQSRYYFGCFAYLDIILLLKLNILCR